MIKLKSINRLLIITIFFVIYSFQALSNNKFNKFVNDISNEAFQNGISNKVLIEYKKKYHLFQEL